MMRLTLFHKLFIAFAAVVTAVIIAVLMFVNWNFKRGFNDYLLAQELQRLEIVAESFVEQYAREGSWDSLREGGSSWHRLLFSWGPAGPPGFIGPMGAPPSLNDLPDGMRGPPPRGPDGPRNRDGLPDFAALTDSRPRPPPHKGRPFELRIALIDHLGEYINGSKKIASGKPSEGATLHRVVLQAEDEVLGWLLLQSPLIIDDALAAKFRERQLALLAWLAPVAMLLALLAAALLVRHFLRPIQQLAAGTKRLTAGEYSHRIELKSRDELGDLARDFSVLAQTLEAEENLRQRWIADTSHELRTPLAVLRSEIEAIQDGIRKPEPRRISALHAQVLSLTKLVNDLHQLSLGDAGLLQQLKQKLDLNQILQDVHLANDARAESRGLEIHLHTTEMALETRGDPSRLFQLFNNLVDNSLQHTDSGGEVRIRSFQTATEVIVQINDSAPGVSDEALPKLFERLYRPDVSRNRHSGGSGLGLAIAEQIVEAHGGKLTATHSPLGGLQVECRMPRHSTEQVSGHA